MFNPKKYSKGNRLQREQTESVLKRYESLYKWKCDGSESLIDIGCGTGDTTANLIAKYMPENCRKIVGIDISESMINFAREHYQTDRINFHQMNIEGDVQLNETFDHAMSFFCFQWIHDHK